MHLEVELNLKPELKEYVSDALEIIRTKFVEDSTTVNEIKSYPIEFAYQQFGDA